MCSTVPVRAARGLPPKAPTGTLKSSPWPKGRCCGTTGRTSTALAAAAAAAAATRFGLLLAAWAILSLSSSESKMGGWLACKKK